MTTKDKIYQFCKAQKRPLTCREIIDSLFPEKHQSFINTCVMELVKEGFLVRDDSCRPYVVFLSKKEYNIKKNEIGTISRPCEEEVEKYLLEWEKLDNYVIQEMALDKLFHQIYPKNTNIEEILVKVATLNDFYSTNIFSGYKVAKHILSLNIDKRLECVDETLVNDIATLVLNEEKIKNFYSFATKFCSHHKPYNYAIYDSYVDKVLRYFRDVDGFADFKDIDLKEYSKFIKIIRQFQNYYSLEKYNLKMLDRYLWMLGKEKFPKKYVQNKSKNVGEEIDE